MQCMRGLRKRTDSLHALHPDGCVPIGSWAGARRMGV